MTSSSGCSGAAFEFLCGGGQEACHYPWTCDAPVTRERIRKGLRQDTPSDGELARGTEQLAYRSGSCPDERSSPPRGAVRQARAEMLRPYWLQDRSTAAAVAS